MANDQVFAVCPVDGSKALLFKYYPAGGAYEGGYVPWSIKDYTSWWQEHLHTDAMNVPVEHLPRIVNEKLLYSSND